MGPEKMKSFLLFLSLVFLTAIATFALAVPVNKHDDHQDRRVRRDIEGVFDAIGNGFEGLMSGMKKVSDKVFVAFNSIFSTDTKDTITTGFAAFGQGLRDAFGNLFGTNGEKVKNGVKKVGDKIKSGWNGKSHQTSTTASPIPGALPSVPPTPDKSAPPEGHVPQEETT